MLSKYFLGICLFGNITGDALLQTLFFVQPQINYLFYSFFPEMMPLLCGNIFYVHILTFIVLACKAYYGIYI